jgi:hypothetical protein
MVADNSLADNIIGRAVGRRGDRNGQPVSMVRLLKAMLPSYPPLLIALAILVLFPALVLFIPQMLR